MAETFAPLNSVAVLLDATRNAVGSATAPVVLADAGVENVNAAVDGLIETGVLRRVLAFTELRFSNSIIEAGGGPETPVAFSAPCPPQKLDPVQKLPAASCK